MHKIDGDGATTQNEFTEGDASQNIPPTVVTDDWLNDVQNDLIKVISDFGQTPTKGQQDQLTAALLEFQRRGGLINQVVQSINNNQASAADVTNFPVFDSTKVKGIEFLYYVFRRSDDGVKKEMGRAYLFYDTQANAWDDPTGDFYNGDGGIVFSIAATTGSVSKLQYTSDDLTGASYEGELKITDIKEIKI